MAAVISFWTFFFCWGGVSEARNRVLTGATVEAKSKDLLNKIPWEALRRWKAKGGESQKGGE